MPVYKYIGESRSDGLQKGALYTIEQNGNNYTVTDLNLTIAGLQQFQKPSMLEGVLYKSPAQVSIQQQQHQQQEAEINRQKVAATNRQKKIDDDEIDYMSGSFSSRLSKDSGRTSGYDKNAKAIDGVPAWHQEDTCLQDFTSLTIHLNKLLYTGDNL